MHLTLLPDLTDNLIQISFDKQVVKRVASRELHSAVSIVRPPGHHAEPNEAMGFCLFNNVAIAASYLLDERVSIVN